MPEQVSQWLEPLLSRELRRVKAPPGVLQRPRASAPVPRRAPSLWFACASAAGLLLASAVGLHTYMTNARPLGERPVAASVRLQAWVQASTGLNIHAACQLCHAGEELRAARVSIGTDAGVY